MKFEIVLYTLCIEPTDIIVVCMHPFAYRPPPLVTDVDGDELNGM